MGTALSAPKHIGREAGRPLGSKSVKRGVNIIELIESDEAPLQIMIQNMLFWTKTSERMGERLRAMLEGEEAVDVREAMKLTGQLLAARENAQKCAVDAAPFCHPKLASITVNPSAPATSASIDEDADPEAAAAAWSEMVNV